MDLNGFWWPFGAPGGSFWAPFASLGERKRGHLADLLQKGVPGGAGVSFLSYFGDIWGGFWRVCLTISGEMREDTIGRALEVVRGV